MGWRDTEAEDRFARLSRPTPDGRAFHPRGRAKTGYLIGEATARRVKRFYAYEFYIQMALFAGAIAFAPERLKAHWLFLGLAVGALCFALERLAMAGLLRRSPRAPTPWPQDAAALRPDDPPRSLEASCTLITTIMILALFVTVALVSHSIDTWLAAALLAMAVIVAAGDARRARR